MYYFLQDSLVGWSFQDNFVIQERQDILTVALGTEEHPGRVWIAGYGVRVRQYFGSGPRSSSSQNSNIMNQISRLKEELMSQIEEKLMSQIQQKVRDQLKDELRHELRREFEEKLESMGISQQHTLL